VGAKLRNFLFAMPKPILAIWLQRKRQTVINASRVFVAVFCMPILAIWLQRKRQTIIGHIQDGRMSATHLYAPQTKILEVRTNLSECVSRLYGNARWKDYG
jgi:hypothetical protein